MPQKKGLPSLPQKGGLKSDVVRHRRPGSGVEPGKALEVVDSLYGKAVTLTPGMITNVILTDRCGLSPMPPNGGTQAVGLVALVTWNDGTRGARSLRDMTLSG